MIGVRRPRTLPPTLAQTVGPEQLEALVTAYREFLAELAAAELIELAHASLGHLMKHFLAV